MYGFNFDKNIKKNSGNYSIKDVEISLINKIKKSNQIDLELYKYAKLKYENLKIEFGIL